jgi:hypothetical protein
MISKDTLGVLLSLGTSFFSAAGGVCMEKYLSQMADPRARGGLGLWEQQVRWPRPRDICMIIEDLPAWAGLRLRLLTFELRVT